MSTGYKWKTFSIHFCFSLLARLPPQEIWSYAYFTQLLTKSKVLIQGKIYKAQHKQETTSLLEIFSTLFVNCESIEYTLETHVYLLLCFVYLNIPSNWPITCVP